MGLLKKWQVEKSNTLTIQNNLVEVRDYSIDDSKLAASSNVLKKIAAFGSVINSPTESPPIYWQFDISESNLVDNYYVESFTPSTATSVLDNDLSTYNNFSTSSTSEEEVFRITFKGLVRFSRIEIKGGIWSGSSSSAFSYYYVSEDGVTWTQITNYGVANTTSEKVFTLSVIVDIPFKYFRVTLRTTDSSQPANLNLYEVIVI